MRLSAILTLAALAVIGCGESLPPTYPVTGTVTYNGKPIDGANVTLVPQDEKVRSAGGLSDAEGKFSVKTYFDPDHVPDGAMAGDYLVTVAKQETREVDESLEPTQQMAQMMKAGPIKSLIPAKYQDPQKSGFKVTITDASPEPLTLDLKD